MDAQEFLRLIAQQLLEEFAAGGVLLGLAAGERVAEVLVQEVEEMVVVPLFFEIELEVEDENLEYAFVYAFLDVRRGFLGYLDGDNAEDAPDG